MNAAAGFLGSSTSGSPARSCSDPSLAALSVLCSASLSSRSFLSRLISSTRNRAQTARRQTREAMRRLFEIGFAAVRRHPAAVHFQAGPTEFHKAAIVCLRKIAPVAPFDLPERLFHQGMSLPARMRDRKEPEHVLIPFEIPVFFVLFVRIPPIRDARTRPGESPIRVNSKHGAAMGCKGLPVDRRDVVEGILASGPFSECNPVNATSR